MDRLWDRFSDVTGWKLSPGSRRGGEAIQLQPAVQTSADGFSSPIFIDNDIDELTENKLSKIEESFVDSLQSTDFVGRTIATSLAEATFDLAERLDSARQTVRRTQAELAARASVIATPEQQEALADRLETFLSDAVMACGCDSAIIYMLDDDTSKLSARAVFGISPSVMEQPARRLEECRTDIESMVQTTVVIDDVHATTIDTWNVPEACESAICCVIQSGDVPIGTLWLLCNEPQNFSHSAAAAARMAARAIGVELTHAVDPKEDTTGKFAADESFDLLTDDLLRQIEADEEADEEASESIALPIHVAADNPVRELAQWQYRSLPSGAELAPGWKADGMIQSNLDHAIGWHTWDILPNGMMAIAIAEAVDPRLTGAMNATVARAAFASHLNYQHTPEQLLSRVSDTLWETSLEEQKVSLLYACVDTETGTGEIAVAGAITAIIGNRYGYRPLLLGDSDALCTHIDAHPRKTTFRLSAGETLLSYTPGLLVGGMTHTSIGSLLHQAIGQNPMSPLAWLHRQLASPNGHPEQGAITLVRAHEGSSEQ